MQTKSKLNDVLDSRNFFVSLITIFVSIFVYNGMQVSNPDILAGEIYDTLSSKEMLPILTLVFTNFVNPLMKMIRSGFNIGFLKSINFWVQVTTVILLVLAGHGMMFPEGTPQKIVEAIFSGNTELIFTVIAANVLNPLYHFFFDKEPPATPQALSATARPPSKSRLSWLKRVRKSEIIISWRNFDTLYMYVFKQHGFALSTLREDPNNIEQEKSWMMWVGALKALNTASPDYVRKKAKTLPREIQDLKFQID